MPAELLAKAPAKINLALDVVGSRSDGYHDIDTIFVQLELADDVIWVEPAAPGLDVEGPARAGVPSGAANLAWRAVVLAAAEAGREANVRLTLHKRIPAAAGLASGSSDAAAALRLAGSAWGIPAGAVASLAPSLGSDVPYFLLGGVARGRGRGELLEALPPLPPHDVVLFPAPPTVAVPAAKTARVFAAFRELGTAPTCRVDVLASLLDGGHHLDAEAFVGANALEPAALAVMPGLATHRGRIEAATGARVALTGAGPTWFWIGPTGGGGAIVERARAAGLAAILTRTAAP